MSAAATVLLPTPQGLERLQPGARLPRHRHAGAYAAVVLAGGYQEAGDAGRWLAGPGWVLVHAHFEGHADEVGPRGAAVLNLPLPADHDLPAAFCVSDVDVLVERARHDLHEAAGWLGRQRAAVPAVQAAAAGQADWPDRLAAALRADPSLPLALWARAMGLDPATLSRGFCKAYGVTPARFRAEARARLALQRLLQGAQPLAALAQEAGFADQAHLTRAVSALTGLAPGALRRRLAAGQFGSRPSRPGCGMLR